MSKNKFYIIIGFVILSMTQLFAQKTSLEEVVEIIKKNNPQLKMYDDEIKSMDSLAKGAKSWMNPQLSSGFFMTPYNTHLWKPNEMNSGMGSFMIGITQMIPNPKKQKSEFLYMSAMSEVEKENKKSDINQLISIAKSNYYQWIILDKKIAIVHENLDLLSYMIKSMEVRYQYNMDKLSTYYKAQSQFSSLQSMIVMLENEVIQKRIILNTVMARSKETPLEIDTLFQLKTYDIYLKDSTIISSKRSDIGAINKTIGLNQLKINLEKSKKLPEFGIKYDHMIPFGNNTQQFNLMLMVNIPMPWSTKMNDASIQSINLKNEALEWQKEMIVNETEGMLASMDIELKNLKKQYAISENNIIPALKKNYQTSLLSWQNNTGNLFEVLDAWETLNMAQLDALDKLQQILKVQVEIEKQLEIL